MNALAIQLRLAPSKIEELSKSGSEGLLRMRVMTAWLKGEYNVGKFGVPSWRILTDALRKKTVNRDDMAENIVRSFRVD